MNIKALRVWEGIFDNSQQMTESNFVKTMLENNWVFNRWETLPFGCMGNPNSLDSGVGEYSHSTTTHNDYLFMGLLTINSDPAHQTAQRERYLSKVGALNNKQPISFKDSFELIQKMFWLYHDLMMIDENIKRLNLASLKVVEDEIAAAKKKVADLQAKHKQMKHDISKA